MKTAARLKFTDEGSRTRIEMRFGVGPLIILIVVSWIMCLAAGIVAYTLTMKEMPQPSEPASLPLFILPPMAAIAIAVVILVSRASAKTDSAFLTDFVKRTLSASEG